MNAIEFVKKFGWKDAKVCLLNCASPEDKWFMRRGDLISGQEFDNLKQIVEAFELVDKFGGFEKANKTLKKAYDNCSSIISIRKIGFECSYSDLQEAINLVEQCQ